MATAAHAPHMAALFLTDVFRLCCCSLLGFLFFSFFKRHGAREVIHGASLSLVTESVLRVQNKHGPGSVLLGFIVLMI